MDNIKNPKCVKCGNIIPTERKKILPETNLCSADCAETIEAEFSYLKREEEYNKWYSPSLIEKVERGLFSVYYKSTFEKFKTNFPKEIEPKLKELSYRKYTTIKALKDFQENKITKDEYKNKFKKFTWWIKEKVESIDGKLIDNPTRYIDCPDCGHLTLVIWSPKNQRYFLGCSEFHNGCAWAKSIWKY